MHRCNNESVGNYGAEAAAAYQGEALTFGPEYLIPKPFDPRLSVVVSSAIGAAMRSGGKPIADLENYKDKLKEGVFKSALLMRQFLRQQKG